MNVFVSYSHKDRNEAERIEKDLMSQGIDVWIDKDGIKRQKPEVWLQQIDNALFEADFVLGIVTNDYLDSTGAREGFATISKDLRDEYCSFIPLFFENEKDIKSIILPSLQGFQFYKEYDQELLKLLEYLKKQQGENPSEILSKIESPDHSNPFYRVRAELFGEDYSLMARAFAEPEVTLYEKVQGSIPVYLFGGRGVGKTMLLKSLLPEVLCSRKKVAAFANAKTNNCNFFGFYFRLKCGCMFNHSNGPMILLAFDRLGMDFNYDLYKDIVEKMNHLEFEKAVKEPVISDVLVIMRTITLNELNYKILKTIIEDLKKYSESSLIEIKTSSERDIAAGISLILNPEKEPQASFDDVLSTIDKQLKKIESYVQDRVLTKGYKESDWIKTGIGFMGDVLGVVKKNIAELQETNVYLLFDEFENLMPVQQTIINEWVKTSQNYIVKVSSKFKGMYTNETWQNNQPIQFNQDCPEVRLDYDLSDDNKVILYQKLLLEICSRLLDISGYKCRDIKELLEEPKIPELPQKVIDEEIKVIRKSVGLTYDESKIAEYRNKLSESAIFRLLKINKKVEGRITRQKRYCGFETFTYLSSGIIRAFLNLTGAAIYKAEQDHINIKEGRTIPLKCQTWAAEIVSNGWLDRVKTVHNIGELGEKTHQLIKDIGYIFRKRLLNHPTEPETLTIALANPLELNDTLNREIYEIFSKGVKESVFYERQMSMKPKNPSKPEMKEFILNRIYAPALKISYRSRWPRACDFTVTEIKNLLDSSLRHDAKKALLNKHGSYRPSPLFGESE